MMSTFDQVGLQLFSAFLFLTLGQSIFLVLVNKAVNVRGGSCRQIVAQVLVFGVSLASFFIPFYLLIAIALLGQLGCGVSMVWIVRNTRHWSPVGKVVWFLLTVFQLAAHTSWLVLNPFRLSSSSAVLLQ